MTKFLLDSGNLNEYREICKLAKSNNSLIWGATTNPTLIAKTLKGRKLNSKEANDLQKEIVMEILSLVPGAVSAEVYADESISAEQMTDQGIEIAGWSNRVYVKLPTTLEGFKARAKLRERNIPINNTLVFSQQQIFAICLQEKILRKTKNQIKNLWPPFISPFIGRLDDKGEDGIALVENGMKIKQQFNINDDRQVVWMLAASVRNTAHFKKSIELKSELITAPAASYREWFMITRDQRKEAITQDPSGALKGTPYWQAPESLAKIEDIQTFMEAISIHKLDIRHPLTDIGLRKFANDWQEIISA